MNQQIKKIKPLKILLQIPVPWVFVLAYLVGVVFQFIFPTNILSAESQVYIKIAGIVPFAIGAFLAAWSLIIFRKARTTTTPGESSKKLVIEGPYQLSRNPMYVSLILAYIGEAGFLTQIWPILVLPLMWMYVNKVVIPLEEDVLRKDFKDQYVDYCTKVRRWL